jgi:hypothetical protein
MMGQSSYCLRHVSRVDCVLSVINCNCNTRSLTLPDPEGAPVSASTYLPGRSIQRTLCGSDSWQRMVAVTPEEISAQAFSAPERRAAASLFALTVLQAVRPS